MEEPGALQSMGSWRVGHDRSGLAAVATVSHRTSLVAQTVKRLAYNAEGLRSIPGLRRSSGEGNGTPLQYSCLENPKDRGAWWATVHWVAKSQTRLSNFTFTFHFHALEKEMATHSSVLTWQSLVGCHLWRCTESDRNEATQQQQ